MKIGLCESCKNAEVIANRRGSVFYLCKLWERDTSFAKYPRLPVLACAGYERKSFDQGEGRSPASPQGK